MNIAALQTKSEQIHNTKFLKFKNHHNHNRDKAEILILLSCCKHMSMENILFYKKNYDLRRTNKPERSLNFNMDHILLRG